MNGIFDCLSSAFSAETFPVVVKYVLWSSVQSINEMDDLIDALTMIIAEESNLNVNLGTNQHLRDPLVISSGELNHNL